MILAIRCLTLAAIAGPALSAAAAGASFTGCVDEEPGARYLLRDPRELRPLVWLEATGRFQNQSFAKYVGSRVTVHGEARSKADRRIVMVNGPQTITRLSDACSARAETSDREGESGETVQERGDAAGVRSVTGCLDEDAGPQYLLRDERQLKPILMLDPKGFSVRGFARHRGKRVEVTPKIFKDKPVERMEVGSITDLSSSCASGRLCFHARPGRYLLLADRSSAL